MQCNGNPDNRLANAPVRSFVKGSSNLYITSGRSLFFIKNLYTLCILADIRDECLFDLVAFSAGYTEDKVIQGGAAEDVNMIT
jgi:hypothetical protein